MNCYENQGIETIVVVFTIIDKKVKILLAKNYLKGNYKLLSRELCNNETASVGVEKTLQMCGNLMYESMEQFYTFTDPYRFATKRMVGISYLTIVKSAQLISDEFVWFDLDDLPLLAYDHKEILDKAIEVMKTRLLKTNIASILLPDKFTLPQLQSVYETLLNVKFDRRNFRRKFLSLGLIKTTGEKEIVKGHRPGLMYKFLPLEYREMEIF
ncbi:MAG: hypothetical protein E7184_02815 [Erysipelotrichaceae bacterium]|nr:hypothetical protein [Erysipelotrichaceae bacterium]